MPVMLLHHSHGKMRRDGFRAAWIQPDFAVDERGRLHGAPGLVDVVVSRGQACIRGPCRPRSRKCDLRLSLLKKVNKGHKLVAVNAGRTDTAHSTCLHVPSIGLIVAGDAVYNGIHP
jgi:hypothetical protein